MSANNVKTPSFVAISLSGLLREHLEEGKHAIASGIYAHGDAESYLGYDLLYRIDSNLELPDGVSYGHLYPSNHPDDMSEADRIDALAFVWSVDGHKRGCVVSIRDAEAVSFAAKRMCARPTFI